MALLTADWTKLGGSYYRKFEIYSMGWADQVDLENFIVCGAAYGGPIALIRDERKFVRLQNSSSGKPVVFIFTSSGQLLSSFKWNSGQFLCMGWSSCEELVCVQDDGSVLRYDIHGSYQSTFSMGQEAKDTKVVDACIFQSYYGTGVVIITSSYRVFLVDVIKEPKLWHLAEIPGVKSQPNAWTVITQDKQSQVLLAYEKSIYVLDKSNHQAVKHTIDFLGPVNSVTRIAASASGTHIAFASDRGAIWIGLSNFHKKLYELGTTAGPPNQIVWCGSKAVIASWRSEILVISCEGAVITYPTDPTVYLIREIDSVRMVGNTSQDMIQRVPDVTKLLFDIGSLAPGAILLEASKEFQKQSHKADEYIRMIRDDLEPAVNQCIEGAGHEYKPYVQKMLIRAAQFGKGFIRDNNPASYVEMCQMLRILNNIRSDRLGIPLTITQLKFLTIPILLDRLLLRRNYYLAIGIAKHLRLPDIEGVSRILAHWACYKVSQTHDDNERLAKDIASKLEQAPGISYSEIANKAVESGRKELAVKLLDHEPRASEQVPLLMKLGEGKQALLKAIKSGDTNLVYQVILSLRENVPMQEFQMTIHNYRAARALYLKYCRGQNSEALRKVYVQEDDFNAQAASFIQESCGATRMDHKQSSLWDAYETYKKGKNEFGAAVCEEQHRLLKRQTALEEHYHREFRDFSLHDTIYELLKMREGQAADKLRLEYKVPDKRYWWLKIMALSEIGDWVELQKLSNSKKPPIGYEAFIDACLQFGSESEARTYIPKVKDDVKIKYFVKTGMFEEGIQFAFEHKDDLGLQYIQRKCMNNKTLIEQIDVKREQLVSRKFR